MSNKSALSFFDFLLFHVQNQGKTVGKNDLKKIIDFFWLSYHWLKHDNLSQNLFLEVKKPEIKETKGTIITPKLKSSYWGPFSGLKSQDLIKTSRTFTGVIFCPRSFSFLKKIGFNWCEIIPLKWSLVCGMDEIFMGQFFVIFNFLFLIFTHTGRFLLGSMHVALDFQILTGNQSIL